MENFMKGAIFGVLVGVSVGFSFGIDSFVDLQIISLEKIVILVGLPYCFSISIVLTLGGVVYRITENMFSRSKPDPKADGS